MGNEVRIDELLEDSKIRIENYSKLKASFEKNDKEEYSFILLNIKLNPQNGEFLDLNKDGEKATIRFNKLNRGYGNSLPDALTVRAAENYSKSVDYFHQQYFLGKCDTPANALLEFEADKKIINDNLKFLEGVYSRGINNAGLDRKTGKLRYTDNADLNDTTVCKIGRLDRENLENMLESFKEDIKEFRNELKEEMGERAAANIENSIYMLQYKLENKNKK